MALVYNHGNNTMRTYEADEMSDISINDGDEVIPTQQMAQLLALAETGVVAGLRDLRRELRASIEYQDNTFHELNARWRADAERFGEVIGRTDRAFAQLKETSAALLACDDEDAKIDDRIQALEDKDVQAADSIEALRSQVSKLTEAVEAIQHQLNLVGQDISDLRHVSIGKLQSQIEDRVSMSHFSPTLSTVEARFLKLEEELGLLALKLGDSAPSRVGVFVERAPENRIGFTTKLTALAWRSFAAGYGFLERVVFKEKTAGQKLVDFLAFAEKEGKIIDVARISELRKVLGLSNDDDVTPLLREYLKASPEAHEYFWHWA